MQLGIKSTISNFYLFTKIRYCYTHIIFLESYYKGRTSADQHDKLMHVCECVYFIYTYTYVCVCVYVYVYISFWSGSVIKNLPANAGDTGAIGSIPGLGKSEGRNGNLFQYSCLENPMDRRVWRVIVRGVAESDTWLSSWAHTHTHTHVQGHMWCLGFRLYSGHYSLRGASGVCECVCAQSLSCFWLSETP